MDLFRRLRMRINGLNDDKRRLISVAVVLIGAISLLLLSLAFIGTFTGFAIYDFSVNEPKAAKIQSDLENELRVIEPLPQAMPTDYYASHKTRQALVGQKYVTSLPYQQIRSYYESEFSKHGWKYHDEELVKVWSKDLGGKTVRFCKGDYTGELQYAGEQSGYNWTYAIDLSWNLYDCK